ncbi:hypothetical protein [Nocardia sp. CNY236]|uniref:hypothetical protein n=1 Tax=Nocardia sp. CNY236 TaxID=1169152 RepID=UPI0003F77AC8|nr:hypothetical protein [Nocardia sp. CNY236]
MTARRHAQIARHIAVVVAGAASLGLTVAAGDFIVHQIANTQHQTMQPSVPATPVVPWASSHDYGDGHSTLRDTTVHRHTDATVHRHTDATAHRHTDATAGVPIQRSTSAESTASHAASFYASNPRTTLSRTLRLGPAAVQAQLTGAGTDTVSISVTTNALAALTGNRHSPLTPKGHDAASVTTVRTDFDSHDGAVRLALSGAAALASPTNDR